MYLTLTQSVHRQNLACLGNTWEDVYVYDDLLKVLQYILSEILASRPVKKINLQSQ